MKTSLIALRASALPLAFRAPCSVRSADMPIHEESEPADLGTAAHEALRALAETSMVPWDALPTLAERYQVDADELRMLVAMAAKLWPSISESFAGAETEVEVSTEIGGVHVTGHVDLVLVSGRVARAADWKTGRKDADYSHQMKAYGALLFDSIAEIEEVTVTVIWVRDGEIENYTMRRADVDAWKRLLVERVVEWDGTFHTGSHCDHCPRAHECPARAAMVRRDVETMLATDAEDATLALMSPEDVIGLYRKASLVVKVSERVRAAVKRHVEANGGELATPDGRLVIVEENRRKLDTIAAWPVLDAIGFDNDDLGACVEVSLSKAEKRVAAKAGRGKGAGAVRDLDARLADANAIRTETIRKLTEKR